MATQDQQNNVQQSNSPLNVQTFKIHGMKHDLSESAFENNFAFENMNMRINIVDSDNTLLNLTNERGTLNTGLTLVGRPIGCKKYANNKILLITTQDGSTSTKDRIYNIVVSNSDVISASDLTQGGKNYGFSSTNPIEIEHYHDGEKDFFYLADGLNNFKTFWIENNTIKPSANNIDYNKEISGTDMIFAQYRRSNTAEFMSGVIVYCFCYISEQGHKTNIIDITDTIPIMNYGSTHGLEPNARANIAIDLGCFKLSNNFDKIEIYSLFRSSLDGEITVRKVATPKILEKSILPKFITYYIDGRKCLTDAENTNFGTPINMKLVQLTDENKGELISYQELLSRFNSLLIPSTITKKSDTIFLGNIKTDNFSNLKTLINSTSNSIEGVTTTDKSNYTTNAFYSKNRYYSGIQVQDKYGNWSPVMKVGEITDEKNITLNQTCVNALINKGYVAVRAMMADNLRLRNSLCEGFGFRTFSIDNGKYGIDYYAAYADNVDNALYNSFASENVYNVTQTNYWDIYSPDVEFNENFVFQKDDNYRIEYVGDSSITSNISTDISISGNIGTLFNNQADVGKFYYDSSLNKFLWYDAITKYQEALQLQFAAPGWGDNEHTNEYTPIAALCDYNLFEKYTKYIIYVWQPSGSLNDSNGSSSVLNYKKIGWYITNLSCGPTSYSDYISGKLFLFDGTNNNIPLGTSGKVYGGILNIKLLQKQWNASTTSNYDGSDPFFDESEYIYKDYTRSTLKQSSFVGYPIQILTGSNTITRLVDYSVKNKLTEDSISVGSSANVRYWNNSTIGGKAYSQTSWTEYLQNEHGKALPILASNSFTRNNQIPVTYKTTKHLVIYNDDVSSSAKCLKCLISTEGSFNNVDIEKSFWIVCSRKKQLTANSSVVLDVNLNDVYKWGNGSNHNYSPLISEPYSNYDINQVYFLVQSQGIHSYINPICKYDKFVILDNAPNNINPLTLSNEFYNKLNMVYNQKNNFFIFSGMTTETVTDDTLENTILYSDMKLANEKEDSFVNFPTTNFYTIDSNINTINKLITYNDKILCFSDDAISQILYNENVVINTESVQSLSLASTDKVTGSQLITNTYGCLNKWSIGIFNNDLYFIDDLNNKLMVYNGEFLALNEKLGIETLNNKLIKNKVWNPLNWYNTKFNIDKYAKDVHYTTSDFDIAFNSEIGAFSSIYSYENIPFIETIGSHTIAFKYNSGNTNAAYLREGNYNQFFGTYKPFYTTVIVNQNSIVNKTLSFIEYSSEAYSMSNNTLVPQHDYTFSHIEFWNDYQESKDSHKVKIDYKMYGQSLLKRKFRIWRINRFRDYTRLPNRNYDMLSNTWHYMKLLTDGTALEQNKKLTFHWLNVYYR